MHAPFSPGGKRPAIAAATCMHLPCNSAQLTCCVAVGCPSGAQMMAGAPRPGHSGVCSAHAAMLRHAPAWCSAARHMETGAQKERQNKDEDCPWQHTSVCQSSANAHNAWHDACCSRCRRAQAPSLPGSQRTWSGACGLSCRMRVGGVLNCTRSCASTAVQNTSGLLQDALCRSGQSAAVSPVCCASQRMSP